jgi:hypothetical protein
MNTTQRFPRASRDNCLRAPDVMQGPYRRGYDVTRAGHRAVALVGAVGIAVAVVLLALVM